MCADSPSNRADLLEALVRTALASGELSTEAAEVVYALSQATDLTDTEQHLLTILNQAFAEGCIKPAPTWHNGGIAPGPGTPCVSPKTPTPPPRSTSFP